MIKNNRDEIQIKIKNTIISLCENKIWTLDPDIVLGWLSNFKNDKDHLYLAHLILDKVIFRSNEMLKSSYHYFFCTTLRQSMPKFIREKYDISSFVNELSKRSILKNYIRIMPVLDNNTTLTESGAGILRTLQSKLHDTYTLNPNDEFSTFSEECLVVIIDDFIGSGHQYENFLNETKIHEKISNLIYVPAMALESGYDYLTKKFPNLNIHPLEIISNDINFFSNKKNYISNDKNLNRDDALKIYEDIKTKNKIKLPDWSGRDNAGLPLIFEWGVPNQSLGILYHHQDNWTQLHSRRS